jgi:hypothetical protein
MHDAIMPLGPSAPRPLGKHECTNTRSRRGCPESADRNIVKALPWYTQVRKLLQNQAYWGWFIPYEGCRSTGGQYVCKNNVTGNIDATANLYHDEEQTPGWTGGGNGGPDGVCNGDTKGNNITGPTQSGACDCGEGVSCERF